MNRYEFSTSCAIAAIAAIIQSAAGQTAVPFAQISSPRTVTAHVAPAVRPVVSAAVAPHFAARPTGFTAQRTSPHIVGQPGTNLRTNYSPAVRPLNQTFARLRERRLARFGSPGMTGLDPARRERVLRAL